MHPLRARWHDLPLFVKGGVIGAIPVVPLVLIAVLFHGTDRERVTAEAMVTRSSEIRAALTNLRTSLADTELGIRASLITHDPARGPVNRARRDDLLARLDRLDTLVAGDPAQTQAAGELRRMVTGRVRVLDGLMNGARAEIQLAEVEQLIRGGEAIADEIRAHVSRMREHELQRLQERRARAAMLATRTKAVVLAGTVGGTAGTVLAAWLFMGGLTQRLQRATRDAIELGAGRSLGAADLSRDEIGQLSRGLRRAGEVLATREAALRQARAEAEDASRAKNEFLSRISHELRTPLNAVIGFAQILNFERLTPEQTDNVKQILRGGHHLLELINEVLDIARIEAGQLSLSPEPINLPESVKHAIDLIRPLADQQGVTLHPAPAIDGAAYAMADRQRLNQILLNLLSNAVKYNRNGGRVDVTSERLDGRVRVSVSDTGYGIPPDRLERMFTPFDRLGAEQSNVEGTGLGLALCKRLAEALGGTLTVTSVPGQGSTFVLDLQAADTPAPESAASHTTSTAAQATAGDVLYIEDNLANVRLMERIIARRPGVRLRHAADGAAGLRLVEEHRPNLLLLDLHLPDMRGEEVLHRLRGSDRTAGIPVAILSADATPAQKRKLLSMGASVYMSKPLNVTQVLELVDSVLPQGPGRAS